MSVHRTIRVKLQPTPDQAAFLFETTDRFTAAFNHVCAVGWEAKEKNGVKLHHLTYRLLKDSMPDLVSDLHIQARVKATETLASVFALAKKGNNVSCPYSKFCPPRYNVHTFKTNWKAGTVKLSTTQGRIDVAFVLPDYFKPMTTGEVCTADLLMKDSGWWLYIVVDIPAPKVRELKQTVGVDLGINRPAVTSNKQFSGKRSWKNTEAKVFNQKRQCQQKGTKSSKRKLRKIKGHQARFRRACDHVLSKKIVQSVKPGGTLVLENLTDIRKNAKGRKRQRRCLHSWSFAQLKEFVSYKAEAAGVRVVMIDPRHTSQCCSKCGHTSRNNRVTQSAFKCRKCGFTLNADLNAARNIRAKHLGTFGTSSRARPSSTGPTGTSVPNAGGLRTLPASRRL